MATWYKHTWRFGTSRYNTTLSRAIPRERSPPALTNDKQPSSESPQQHDEMPTLHIIRTYDTSTEAAIHTNTAHSSTSKIYVTRARAWRVVSENLKWGRKTALKSKPFELPQKLPTPTRRHKKITRYGLFQDELAGPPEAAACESSSCTQHPARDNRGPVVLGCAT